MQNHVILDAKPSCVEAILLAKSAENSRIFRRSVGQKKLRHENTISAAHSICGTTRKNLRKNQPNLPLASFASGYFYINPLNTLTSAALWVLVPQCQMRAVQVIRELSGRGLIMTP